eukprot:gene10404-2933_t
MSNKRLTEVKTHSGRPKSLSMMVSSLFSGRKKHSEIKPTKEVEISGPTGFQRTVHGTLDEDGSTMGVDALKAQVEKMKKEIEAEITWEKLQEAEKSSKKHDNLKAKFAQDVEKHKGKEFVSYLNQIAGNDPQVTTLRFHRKTKGRSRVGVGGTRGLEYVSVVFKNNTRITEIDLYDMDLTEHGMKEFCDVLIENVYVEILNLGRNFIGRSAKEVSRVVNETESITNLNLSENFIRTEDSIRLFEAMEQNDTILKLDVSKNLFGCEGLEVLCKSLYDNETLRILNLSGNDLGPYGAYIIGCYLKENKTLKVLNLNNNKLRVEGIKLLSFALFDNTSLEEINLDKNKMKDEGLQYFIRKEKKLSENLKTITFSNNSISKGSLVKKFLEKNTSITSLDISNNKIGKGMHFVFDFLKDNKTLTDLNLNGNHIKKEGLKNLINLLDDNKTLKNIQCYNNQIEDNKAEKYYFKNPEKTSILHFYTEEREDKEQEKV